MAHPDFGTCPVCGNLTLPVLSLPPCGHDEPATVAPLTATGTVYAWTRSWAGSEPTVMAMVDFFDGRLRITGPVDADEIAVGDTVTAETADATPFVLKPV